MQEAIFIGENGDGAPYVSLNSDIPITSRVSLLAKAISLMIAGEAQSETLQENYFPDTDFSRRTESRSMNAVLFASELLEEVKEQIGKDTMRYLFSEIAEGRLGGSAEAEDEEDEECSSPYKTAEEELDRDEKEILEEAEEETEAEKETEAQAYNPDEDKELEGLWVPRRFIERGLFAF